MRDILPGLLVIIFLSIVGLYMFVMSPAFLTAAKWWGDRHPARERAIETAPQDPDPTAPMWTYREVADRLPSDVVSAIENTLAGRGELGGLRREAEPVAQRPLPADCAVSAVREHLWEKHVGYWKCRYCLTSSTFHPDTATWELAALRSKR